MECASAGTLETRRFTQTLGAAVAKGTSSGEALLLTAGLMQLCRFRDGRDIFHPVASGQHSVAYFAAMVSVQVLADPSFVSSSHPPSS